MHMENEPIDIQAIANEILDMGMTQCKIAKRIGCSQGLISEIVNGLRGTVKPSKKMTESLIWLLKDCQRAKAAGVKRRFKRDPRGRKRKLKGGT